MPQGSCLGPLLFTVYTSKLFDTVGRHLPSVHSSADDKQLYLAFSPNVQGDDASAMKAICDCIMDLRKWMIRDRLMLNDDKTEFLLLGTKQQLAKVDINSITVGGSVVNTKPVVRNLGSWFDSQLSMSTHISKLCSSAFFHLHNISRIRKFLRPVETKSLLHAFVPCNSLLYGLPASQLNKVQRVLNTAARLVCCAPRFSHVTPLMYELHWLPLKQRIHFKILLFAFKAIHGIAPTYIQNLVSLKSQGTYNLRSSGEILLASSTFRTKVTLGDRSFQVAAPKLWNAFPRELRDIPNLHTFKSNLKTYLSKFAYG